MRKFFSCNDSRDENKSYTGKLSEWTEIFAFIYIMPYCCENKMGEIKINRYVNNIEKKLFYSMNKDFHYRIHYNISRYLFFKYFFRGNKIKFNLIIER